MDEKEKELELENENASAEDNAGLSDAGSSEKKDSVNYESGDDWQFEASAPMLDDKALSDAGFDIDPQQLRVQAKRTDEADNRSVQKGNEIVIKRDGLVFIPVAVISVIVIAVLVFLGVRYYTVPNGKEGDLMNPASVIAQAGDTKISIGMFNYYYNSLVTTYENYANYGYYDLDTSKDYATQYTTDEDGNKISWKEFFENAAMEQLESLAVYYDAGIKSGLTLNDKQKEAIESQMSSYKEQASSQGVSLDSYLEDNLGEYCTEATLRTMLEQIFIGSAYKGITKDGIEISDDSVNAYFNEHKQDYYQINYCRVSLEYDSTSEETKAASDNLIKDYMSRIKDRESLIELLPEIYKDFIDQQVASLMESDSSKTKEAAEEEVIEMCEQNIDATLYGSDEPFDEEVVEWLFSSDTKEGDVNYFVDNNTGYAYIFLKTEEPVLVENKTYSVRHILIQPEADSEEAEQSGEYTDEQWAAAEEEANKILKEYNDGEKTEKAFGDLANKYSDDTGSTSSGSYAMSGGYYEGVTTGEMVESFEQWGMDDSRKYGDVEIVKSDYGYHIMYFVNHNPEYKAKIITQLKEDALADTVKDIDLKLHKSVIDKAVEDYYASKSSDTTAQ